MELMYIGTFKPCSRCRIRSPVSMRASSKEKEQPIANATKLSRQILRRSVGSSTMTPSRNTL